MWVFIITAVAAAFPAYLLWSAIHELSHVGMVATTAGVKSWSIRLLPHRIDGRFYWASARWETKRDPTPTEKAYIYLAPRIGGLAAVIMFPFFGAIPDPLVSGLWFAVLGGGIVDLIIGSIGYSEFSDLRRAADAWETSPWALRIPGMGIALVSVTSGVVLKLLLM